MILTPRNDFVLVAPLKQSERTPGSIVLPEQSKEKPTTGTVVAFGPGKLSDDGKHFELVDMEVGQEVVFAQYAGAPFKYEGEEYLFLRQQDIIATIEGE